MQNSPFALRTALCLTAVLIAATVGCVPQTQVVKLQDEMNALRAEMKDAKGSIPDLSGIEKRQDRLEAELKSTTGLQQSIADQGARFDQMTTDLQIMQGKLEENNFRLKELAQKIDDKSYKIAELSARVDQLEARLASGPSGTAPAEKKPDAKSLEPTAAYQQAKSDYDKGNYDLAIAGFVNFLKQFPDTSLAGSAQYWIGECYYSKGDYDRAIKDFTALLKLYPKSEKAPGARLKIGYSYLNQKNRARAKEQLHRVIKDYPRSKEASLARDTLRRIRQKK